MIILTEDCCVCFGVTLPHFPVVKSYTDKRLYVRETEKDKTFDIMFHCNDLLQIQMLFVLFLLNFNVINSAKLVKKQKTKPTFSVIVACVLTVAFFL